MKRIAIVFLLSWGAALFGACGEDMSPLEGSQCDLIDCDFDRIDCQLYSPPNLGIIVHYKRVLEEEGERWTAKIIIQLDDLDLADVTGSHLFEDTEFINRVMLQRPGELERWPEFDGNFCEFDLGDTADGAGLSGKCSFKFTNGYFLTARYGCDVELI